MSENDGSVLGLSKTTAQSKQRKQKMWPTDSRFQ